MADSLFPLAYLRDARLAGYATAAAPVWLWQADGRRLLWANGAAAALAGAASVEGLATRGFDEDDPFAAQIARLADTLPSNGSPRLSALEGLGGEFDRSLTALCSRLIGCMTPAVLIVSTEAVQPALPLRDRLRLLLGDAEAPIAAFAAHGELIYATEAAATRLQGMATLTALGIDALGVDALAKGHAEGDTPLGRLRLDRLGRDATAVVLVSLPPHPAAQAELGPPATTEILAPEFTQAMDAPAAAETPQPVAEAAPAAYLEPPSEAAAAGAEEGAAEPRPPYRFVWAMDQDGRFTVTSQDFLDLIGPESSTLLGRPWIDINSALKLDPGDHVARAVDSRETWSGITVHWPVDGTPERLNVELSGLPTFDRERAFLGYRGFGVYRDIERLLEQPHAERPRADDAVAGASLAEPRQPPQPTVPAPTLSPGERTAFRELARQLSARLKGDQPDRATADAGDASDPSAAPEHHTEPRHPAAEAAMSLAEDGARGLLDRLPIGVLIYRVNTALYANRAFLSWSGDASLETFSAGGGLDRLFLESGIVAAGEDAKTLPLSADGARGPAESRLFSTMWDGERAHALAIMPASSEQIDEQATLRRIAARMRELRTAFDIAADGFVICDADGRVVRLSATAEALFDCSAKEMTGHLFTELLAPDSRAGAAAVLEKLVGNARARHRSHQVMSRGSDAERVALLMTIGRIEEDGEPRYCAVFHDISVWKRNEQELRDAKQQAEQASRAKSDFLAKISHEIRTPLNAIIGFSEVMMEERLGPIENERYRAYLKDIHASGEHLVALLNDLLDLSKIEAGKLELKFSNVNLNELTQECVGLMQPQANSGRVIIRTSLAPGLPQIVADARSVRQILLNLLSNSIKFTGAGGQVIVSTTLTDHGEAVLRVRDTGIGMSEQEIEVALEPFRQIETSARSGSGGTGLGLPLTKALAEANRANFAIRSGANAGTLVEVAFPTLQAPQQ